MISQKKVIQILKEIEARHGVLTPRDLVEEAKDKNHPLHDRFEWNDNRAGDQYRLWQARHLIAEVQVEFLGKETDAFWNIMVQVEDVKSQGYYSTERVLNDEELYLKVLQTALRELRYWQNKYKDLKELRSLVDEEAILSLEKR